MNGPLNTVIVSLISIGLLVPKILAESEPDWQAKYEAVVAAQRSTIIVPTLGRVIRLERRIGGSVYGTLVSLTATSVTIRSASTDTTYIPAQLTPESALTILVEDAARAKAMAAVKKEKAEYDKRVAVQQQDQQRAYRLHMQEQLREVERAKALEAEKLQQEIQKRAEQKQLADVGKNTMSQPGMSSRPSIPSTKAYKSRIESDSDDVLILDNGGVVQITAGYIGYIGFRKHAVLFGTQGRWKLWIEGKKTFKCDLLKEPTVRPLPAELSSISNVAGDGEILKMIDGAIYEVNSLDVINTRLWLGMTDALILDGSEVINLDEGELVGVTKLK